MCTTSVFILLNHDGCDRHRPRGGWRSAANVSWLFRERWHKRPLPCQMGSCYLSWVRRKHFCRRQGTQSPLSSLRRKSGFTQDVDVRSIWRAHMYPVFFLPLPPPLMAIFIVLLCPDVRKGCGSFLWKKQVFPVSNQLQGLHLSHGIESPCVRHLPLRMW